jgi:hypothetical protein
VGADRAASAALPHRLRYRIGYDHDLCRRVLGALTTELQRYYRSKSGLRRGQTGSVTFIQRFNSGLAMSPHFHLFALDGAFVDSEKQGLQFITVGEPSTLDLGEIVSAVRARVEKLLRRIDGERRGDGDDDDLSAESPALAACCAASIMRRTAFGPTSGKRIVQLGGMPNAPWVALNRRRHAHDEGFDLHADVVIAASDRQGLEQVLRYGARPAVAGERLRFTPDGRVALELKRRYHDGTTHLVFEPLAFVERLAALIPRPHKNLVIYSGVLAPNAKLRRKVVAYGVPRDLATRGAGEGTRPCEPTVASDAATTVGERRRPNYAWADLMRRAFGVDVLQCPHCGDRLKLLAAVMSPPAIRAILASLGLPIRRTRVAPGACTARATRLRVACGGSSAERGIVATMTISWAWSVQSAKTPWVGTSRHAKRRLSAPRNAPRRRGIPPPHWIRNPVRDRERSRGRAFVLPSAM